MKKLLFLLPFVAMTLAGCNNKQPESIQPSAEDSSEVISSEVSSEEDPSEVSSEEDPSEISSEEDPSEVSSEEDPSDVSSEDLSQETSEVEGMSPEEALTKVASYWSGSVVEVETGVYGVYGAFSAASYSVEDMKGYVSNAFVPEEFELANDWTVADDGTNSCAYINAVSTVLEFYVYAKTFYVDGDGKIVDEGTEGATAVEATCIEVYAYTAK